MFCVSTQQPGLRRCSSAMAACPAFGAAPRQASPSWARYFQHSAGSRCSIGPDSAASIGAAATIWIVTFGHTLPGIRALWLSPRIAEAAAAAATCPDPVLVSLPYHEPSLVFLHGPYRTRLAHTPDQAAAAFREAACAVAAIGALVAIGVRPSYGWDGFTDAALVLGAVGVTLGLAVAAGNRATPTS